MLKGRICGARARTIDSYNLLFGLEYDTLRTTYALPSYIY